MCNFMLLALHFLIIGEKPHKCKKCGRGFKQLTHLTYHMRTHSDIKMYTCAYCGKGFNQKGNLQAHIYGHTGEDERTPQPSLAVNPNREMFQSRR